MNILFHGKISGTHSISIVNYHIVRELQRNGHANIHLKPKEGIEYDVEIRHTYPPNFKSSVANKLIFIQPWEFNKVPMEWIYQFNRKANLLIVPSKYNKEIYENAGIDCKIDVIPNGIDNKALEKKRIQGDLVTYLYIGSHQYRKGIDILLDVWEGSFCNDSKKKLIIKLMNHVYGKSIRIQERIKNIPNVMLITDELDTLTHLYDISDVLIVPSRGEAFCMPVMEAISNGINYIICPEVGPYKEYVTINSYLKCKPEIVDPVEHFIGKPGDAYSGMGGHFVVFSPLKADLEYKIKNYKSSLVLDHKYMDWISIGKIYNSKLIE
tara:strand:+ start:458 stop:1429 length:972 start_codon:yes stop_codon:yes gene_type:complete